MFCVGCLSVWLLTLLLCFGFGGVVYCGSLLLLCFHIRLTWVLFAYSCLLASLIAVGEVWVLLTVWVLVNLYCSLFVVFWGLGMLIV